MEITATSVALYLLDLVLGNWLWITLVVIAFALPAPYYALKLIRRNRCLGRDIYRELAQADRFMEIWNAQSSLSSNDQQYIFAFVTNGNSAAAHNMKIDAILAEYKLVQRSPVHGTFGGSTSIVSPMRGRYLLRNWLVFLLLLWLRVAIFGDRFSHIASGNGKFNEKMLKRMYWETSFALIALFVLIIILLGKFL